MKGMEDMNAILRRKKKEIQEEVKTLTDSQYERHIELIGQMKLIEELLEPGPCWHPRVNLMGNYQGHWECPICEGIWDHYPADKEKPQYSTYEEFYEAYREQLTKALEERDGTKT